MFTLLPFVAKEYVQIQIQIVYDSLSKGILNTKTVYCVYTSHVTRKVVNELSIYFE